MECPSKDSPLALPRPRTSSVSALSAASDKPTPCRECSRRKIKCDGAMPVCSVCRRYRRHCLYDKHSRTRLTRKHVTALEERLEKAEALLKAYVSPEELAGMLDATTAAGPSTATATADTTAAIPSNPAGNIPPRPPAPTSAASSVHQKLDLAVGIRSGEAAGLAGSVVHTGLADDLVAQSVANDFEWNEQESAWAASGPSLDVVSGDDSHEDIMDGMASLSVGEHRGYLGAMSGAALLRQILSACRNDEIDDTLGETGGTPEQYLEALLQQEQQRRQRQEAGQSQMYRTQSMLTRVAVGELIDAFFALYHPTFPILHEAAFRAQCAGSRPRPDRGGAWSALANIVAALGSFAGSNCADATDLTIFRDAQRGLFADNLEAGNLTLVQGFALSATYLQKRNRPNTGYNYGGIALRMAIGLGLHKEFKEGQVLSLLQMEVRRRVWWTLCVLDVGVTITYGRPLNWPQAGVEAALPRNINEEDLVVESTSYPADIDGVSLYTYLRVQSWYHLKTMGIYNRLISLPPPTSAELVALDDEDIGSWLAHIPSYYSVYPPAGSRNALGVGITKWRYRNLRIVMYRPFLVRWALGLTPYDQPSSSSTEMLAVFRCLDAARESIFSIEEYCTSQSHSRLSAFYVLYFLFHATLIPVHCLRQNPQHTLASDWRKQILSSLAVMSDMADLNPNSGKCREITIRLCWPHLQGDDAPPPYDSCCAALVPELGEGEPATTSVMSGYDAWCGLIRDTMGPVEGEALYQWPDIGDPDMNFFYAVGGGYWP